VSKHLRKTFDPQEKAMIGDSLNLVDMIRGYIPSGFTDKFSSLSGDSKEKTQAGLTAAVPGLLSGLTSAGSTEDGARRFTDAVKGADESVLSNPGSLFEKATSGEGGGSGILGSILGGSGLSDLTGNIGRASGMSGKGVTALLGFLAPMVLGALKNLMRTKGLDSGGLLNLLSSQRNNFAAAMPEGIPGRTAEPASYIREPLRDVSKTTEGIRAKAEPYVEGAERAAKSSRSWVLPLVALLGLLGLLWYWGSRPATHAGNETRSATEQVTRPNTGYSATTAGTQSLRERYQSVIDLAQSEGIQLSSLSEQNGTLVIEGSAPSLEAANRIWDEIKRINPSMNDIVANFPVNMPRGF
jgi:hypothetical protein